MYLIWWQDKHVQQHLHHDGSRSGEVPRCLSSSPLQGGTEQVHQGPLLHPARHPGRGSRQHHQVLRGEDRDSLLRLQQVWVSVSQKVRRTTLNIINKTLNIIWTLNIRVIPLSPIDLSLRLLAPVCMVYGFLHWHFTFYFEFIKSGSHSDRKGYISPFMRDEINLSGGLIAVGWDYALL